MLWIQIDQNFDFPGTSAENQFVTDKLPHLGAKSSFTLLLHHPQKPCHFLHEAIQEGKSRKAQM